MAWTNVYDLWWSVALVLYSVALDPLSCKINHSHEGFYMEGFYMIPKGWQVSESANHFFTEISREFARWKKAWFDKFRPFPGSFTRHIATISLKDLTTYGNHAIWILFYKRDIEIWKSPENISFEHEYLKNFQNYK